LNRASRALKWGGFALAAVAMLIACGGASAQTRISGEHVTVLMFDDRFQYDEIHIPVGGSVDWVGAGRNPHNAVASDGSWSTETVFGSLEQLEGDSAVLTYDRSGEYVFFCTLHGNAAGNGMAGVLVVGGGAGDDAG